MHRRHNGWAARALVAAALTGSLGLAALCPPVALAAGTSATAAGTASTSSTASGSANATAAGGSGASGASASGTDKNAAAGTSAASGTSAGSAASAGTGTSLSAGAGTAGASGATGTGTGTSAGTDATSSAGTGTSASSAAGSTTSKTTATSSTASTTTSAAPTRLADVVSVRVLGSSSAASGMPAGLSSLAPLTDKAVYSVVSAGQGEDGYCCVAFNLDLEQGQGGARSILCGGFNTRDLTTLPLLKAQQDGVGYLLVPVESLPVPTALASFLGDWSFDPAQAQSCPWAWTGQFSQPNLGNLASWLTSADYTPQWQAEYDHLQVAGYGAAWYLRVPWARLDDGSNPQVRVGTARQAWVVNLFYCATVEANAQLPDRGALMAGKVGSALQVRAVATGGAQGLGTTYYANGPYTRLLFYVQGSDGASFSLAPLNHDQTGVSGLMDHLSYFGCQLDAAQGTPPVRFSAAYEPSDSGSTPWEKDASQATSYTTLLGKGYLRMPSSVPVLVGSGQVNGAARYTLLYSYDYVAASSVAAGSTFVDYAEGLAPLIQGRIETTDSSTGATQTGPVLGTCQVQGAQQLTVRTLTGSYLGQRYALVPVHYLEQLFGDQGYAFDAQEARAHPSQTPFVACEGVSSSDSWKPATQPATYFCYGDTWYLQVPAQKGVASLYSDSFTPRQVSSTVFYQQAATMAEKVRVQVNDPDGNGVSGASFRVLTATGAQVGVQGTTDQQGSLELCDAQGTPLTLSALESLAGAQCQLVQTQAPQGYLAPAAIPLRVQDGRLELGDGAPAGVSVANPTQAASTQRLVATVTVVDSPAEVICAASTSGDDSTSGDASSAGDASTSGDASVAARFALYEARRQGDLLQLKGEDPSGSVLWAQVTPSTHNANLGQVTVGAQTASYRCDPATGVLSFTLGGQACTVSPATDAASKPLVADANSSAAHFSLVARGTYVARQLTAPAATSQGLGPEVSPALAEFTVGEQGLSAPETSGVTARTQAQKNAPVKNLLALGFEDAAAVAPGFTVAVTDNAGTLVEDEARGAYGDSLAYRISVDTTQNAGLAGTAAGIDADYTLTLHLSNVGLFVPDLDSLTVASSAADADVAADTQQWEKNVDYSASLAAGTPLDPGGTLTVTLKRQRLQQLGAQAAVVTLDFRGNVFVGLEAAQASALQELRCSLTYGPASADGPVLSLGTQTAVARIFGFALCNRESEDGPDLGSFVYTLTDAQGKALTFSIHVHDKDDDGAPVYVVSTGSGQDETSQIVTSRKGFVQVFGLAPGTYELREVEVPRGYDGLVARVPIRLVVDDDGNVTATVDEGPDGTTPVKDQDGLITVSAKEHFLFPDTGMGGVGPFWVAGIVLLVLAGAGGLGLWLWRRRARG